MYDGTADQLSVSFPANEQFVRLGRVTVSGLALRLGIDLSVVENLRLAVDAATKQLGGPGCITLQATWEPGHFAIDLVNEAITIDPAIAAQLTAELRKLVDEVQISANHIVFAVEDESEFTPVASTDQEDMAD